MEEVISVLKSKPDLLAGNGCADEEIIKAEKLLGLKFSREYKEYLKNFRIAAYDGHELTGLVSSDRTNVVKVTKEEKNSNALIPEGMYVLERLNIEEVVIWQNEIGEVFYSMPARTPVKIFDSWIQYISAEYQ